VQTRVRVPPAAPAAPPTIALPPVGTGAPSAGQGQTAAVAPPPSAPAPPRSAAPPVQAIPAAVPAPGAAAPAGGTLTRVGFAAGSSDLPESAKAGLKAIADRMNRDADMRVQLLAYAGPREDTASQARRLSLFRALAVRSYLIEQGVRSTRMDVRAMGNRYEEEPADRVDVTLADR